MTKLHPHPHYKDSGQPWLGEVPAHWEVRRNGRLFSHRVETGYPELPVLEVSLKTGVRVRDMDSVARKQVMSDFTKYKRACKGDLAYNMMRMWQGAVGIAPVDGLVSPAYVVARPFEGTNVAYCNYLFRTAAYMDEVNNVSRGIVSDRNRLYWDEFKQIGTPFPPPEEQTAIVRFLAALDRRVNRLVRAKRRLIELLTEQKQAIITHAVTRGLNPNVKTKHSGINLLGVIPDHWNVKRLRSLVTRIDQGVSPQAENRLADSEGSFGVLKSGCVNRGIFRPTEHKRLPISFEFDPLLQVDAGDVLISRACGSADLVGSVGRVTPNPFKLILSDKTFRPIFAEKKLIAFLVFAMNASIFRQQVRLAISGAEGLANNLPLSSLRDLLLPVPPPKEAESIAQWIDANLDENGKAIAIAERETALIREYRTRLVADVVTGKLDVREAATQMPNEAFDPEVPVESEADLDETEDSDDTADFEQGVEA